MTIPELLLKKIRSYKEDIADYMTSGIESHTAYVQMVGKHDALVLVEREILDLLQEDPE